MVMFVIWWGRQVLRITRSDNKHSHDLALAKLGAIVTFMLAGASVVDYPLRTPLAAITFALACCWLSRVGIGQDDQTRTADRSMSGSIAFRPRVR
jgi:Na+/H+ antiporter NhaD/arsenite permease-like protein